MVKQLVQSLPNLSGEPGTAYNAYLPHGWGCLKYRYRTQGLPRVQEIFEARNPKGSGHHRGQRTRLHNIEEDASTRTKKVFVKGETGEGEYVVPFTARMRVES